MSIKTLLEDRLKLKINEAKSAIAYVPRRKFLGYRFNQFKESKICIAPESVKRFRSKVKKITRGHRRENMDRRIKKLNWLILD